MNESANNQGAEPLHPSAFRLHPSDVVSLAQALLRIPSPTGHEAEIARFMEQWFHAAGFECVVDDVNTVIAWRVFGPGPTLLLDGHIDTVPAEPEAWRFPPYGGEIHEGRLYGRGASDMKGAVAAMMTAAATCAASVAAGQRRLGGALILTGTSWEEPFEGYTLSRAFRWLEGQGLRPDYVIIGEASEGNVKRGQRGRARVLVDIKGRPAHSAHPEAGLNAVYQAARLIAAVRAQPPAEHPVLGKAIREVIGIRSWPDPPDSVVPSACRVTYDLRLLPGETAETVLAEFRRLIAACQAEDREFEAEVSLARDRLRRTDGAEEWVTAAPPAWLFPETHPFVQTALAALRDIGQQPGLAAYNFCTNGSFSAGVAGVPTIGYGPGREALAHIVDESVPIADLHAAAEGYAAIAAAVLGR